MPSARQTKRAGLALSGFVGLAAAVLAYRQHSERRRREEELSAADAEYVQSQDRRRAAGSLLMVVLALGLAVGSSLPHMGGGRYNPEFVIVWLLVFVLIVVLLGLALVDLLATRRYASRQRRGAHSRAPGGRSRRGATARERTRPAERGLALGKWPSALNPTPRTRAATGAIAGKMHKVRAMYWLTRCRVEVKI